MLCSYIREATLAASVLALEGLLAGVRAVVNSQGTSLDEPLSAPCHCARIRPFVCMYFVVTTKVRLAIECLKTRD